MKTTKSFQRYIFQVILFLSFICQVSKAQVKTGKPNVLIIMADDCTHSDLSLYGGINVQTPNIEKLASQGMIFNKAFVTMSMCVPCRAELYTGLQPVGNGVCWNHSPARNGVKSVVQYLGELGYRTGIAGKVHASPRSVFPFEMVEGIERDCVSETANFESGGLTEFVTRKREQPFCLVTALVVPHAPWTVGDPSHFIPDKLELPPYMADTRETRENYARYLAEIEVLDQQIGEVLKVISSSGLENNTLVFFTSEQGSQFPFCKWTNWNNGVHTGFIVKWPGKIQAGIRTDALIQYADVLPTILEAAGADKVNLMDGTSFLNVLLGKKTNHRNYAYFMHNNIPEGPSYPIRSVSDGRYHYIRNLTPENLYIEKHLMGAMSVNSYWSSWMFNSQQNPSVHDLISRYMKRPAEELYNMTLDPFELQNLVEREDLKKIKNLLSAKLDKWMKEQKDPGISVDSQLEWNAANKGNHFN